MTAGFCAKKKEAERKAENQKARASRGEGNDKFACSGSDDDSSWAFDEHIKVWLSRYNPLDVARDVNSPNDMTHRSHSISLRILSLIKKESAEQIFKFIVDKSDEN